MLVYQRVDWIFLLIITVLTSHFVTTLDEVLHQPGTILGPAGTCRLRGADF